MRYIFSRNKLLTAVLAFFIVISNTFILKADNMNDKLIVFHIDLNSVALKKEYIMKWLKEAAEMGYNAVLWEVEDKIKWETCPECVNKEAFSKEEFNEILSYSRSLGLEPIPLLQTIGHAEYVLQHEKYFPLREDSERYDCYCTSNADVKKLLTSWIDEYVEVFGDIRYFHLGGDEAYVFATDSVCSARAEEIGKGTFYAEYMTEIAQGLIKKNIRPGIWSDMILHYYDGITAVPKEFIIWDWNYWDGIGTPPNVMVWHKGGRLAKEKITDEIKEEFPMILDASGSLVPFYTVDYLQKHGFDVILASSSRSYGDGVFAGEQEVHAPNIIGAAKKTINAGLLGTCVTSWAVRIPNFETQKTWLYLAPLAMKNPDKSYEQLIAESHTKTFGIPAPELSKAFILTGYSFTFANEKSTGIGWTGLKDMAPAPEGYINEFIQKLKTSGRWDNIKEEAASAPGKIAEGLSILHKAAPGAVKGYDILKEWNKAGYFQYWQAAAANAAVKESRDKDMLQLLKSLRAEYKNWASEWMYPTSAEINAGLIYDALIDYFTKLN